MSRPQETVATFEVRITVPTGSNISTVEEYIRSAVTGWAGAGDPADPIFSIDRESIVVKLKEKKTTYR